MIDDHELLRLISALTPRQRKAIEKQLQVAAQPVLVAAHPGSDFATAEFCDAVGDLLKNHHLHSDAPLTKELFEHMMVTAFLSVGVNALKLPRGNPGQDIEVRGIPWSLKTQANATISEGEIWISKFMELGRGDWVLPGLRTRMLEHMTKYDRIFTMRALSANLQAMGGDHVYELVEIPKDLLAADSGIYKINTTSRQRPQPGYYTVLDSSGGVKFRLYFDGGTERKLQVQQLKKRYCTVHATWSFPKR